MATFTVYNNDEAESLKSGQQIYPVESLHIHTGRKSIELYTAPPRTNSSHEIKLEGWLGTTNNIQYTAFGIYQVEIVKIRTLKSGDRRVDVKATRIK